MYVLGLLFNKTLGKKCNVNIELNLYIRITCYYNPYFKYMNI